MFGSNPKGAWDCLRKLTGIQKQKVQPDVDNVLDFCNELNDFYTRFDVHDFSVEFDTLCQSLSTKNNLLIIIKQEDAIESLHRVETGKA